MKKRMSQDTYDEIAERLLPIPEMDLVRRKRYWRLRNDVIEDYMAVMRFDVAAELRKSGELLEVALTDLRQEAKRLMEARQRIEKLEAALKSLIEQRFLVSLEQTLEYLKDEEGKSHKGYFWSGWAGAQLDELRKRIRAALEDDDGRV